MKVRNFLHIAPDIATSGQPSVAELAEIAEAGYQTVINLALSSSDDAIPNEGDIVTRLGMAYVHIPVIWEQPTLEQFRLFAAVMQQQSDRRVWVHCALNMRVSAFLYLYSVLYLHEDENRARHRLARIWQPNDIWSRFIADVTSSHGGY